MKVTRNPNTWFIVCVVHVLFSAVIISNKFCSWPWLWIIETTLSFKKWDVWNYYELFSNDSANALHKFYKNNIYHIGINLTQFSVWTNTFKNISCFSGKICQTQKLINIPTTSTHPDVLSVLIEFCPHFDPFQHWCCFWRTSHSFSYKL